MDSILNIFGQSVQLPSIHYLIDLAKIPANEVIVDSVRGRCVES